MRDGGVNEKKEQNLDFDGGQRDAHRLTFAQTVLCAGVIRSCEKRNKIDFFNFFFQ